MEQPSCGFGAETTVTHMLGLFLRPEDHMSESCPASIGIQYEILNLSDHFPLPTPELGRIRVTPEYCPIGMKFLDSCCGSKCHVLSDNDHHCKSQNGPNLSYNCCGVQYCCIIPNETRRRYAANRKALRQTYITIITVIIGQPSAMRTHANA